MIILTHLGFSAWGVVFLGALNSGRAWSLISCVISLELGLRRCLAGREYLAEDMNMGLGGGGYRGEWN